MTETITSKKEVKVKKKKLYLANPYGFSKQTKTLLSEFIEIFNDLNVEVF